MTTRFEALFALHYRGRHQPEDALWWLTHPTKTGPSGAPPPQNVFVDTLSSFDEQHDRQLAAALLTAALELLRTDVRATTDALNLTQVDLETISRSSRSDYPS